MGETPTFVPVKRTMFPMQTLKTDTRKRILAVSRKLFLKKGFRDTTTRDIAGEAGITLSNLYHYYPSKDDLFRSLLKPATDALEELLHERHGKKGYDISKIQEDCYADEEMDEYIKSHLARHKVPKYIEFVDEFPMNAAGKVLKYKMREEAVARLGL